MARVHVIQIFLSNNFEVKYNFIQKLEKKKFKDQYH